MFVPRLVGGRASLHLRRRGRHRRITTEWKGASIGRSIGSRRADGPAVALEPAGRPRERTPWRDRRGAARGQRCHGGPPFADPRRTELGISRVAGRRNLAHDGGEAGGVLAGVARPWFAALAAVEHLRARPGHRPRAPRTGAASNGGRPRGMATYPCARPCPGRSQRATPQSARPAAGAPALTAPVCAGAALRAVRAGPEPQAPIRPRYGTWA